ncbi:MAG: hypothetical protein IKJ74_06305 [Clostridia bacterium]|nr:hypothetical protein [Clostridia bacterium]
MKTDLYLHHSKYICAIVTAKEGYKFIDNIERFCHTWTSLIEEAKAGFESFPFYDRYNNYDIDFWEHYLDIVEGEDDNYTFLGCICDGIIDFASEFLTGKGEYFDPLCVAIKLSEIYDFHSIRDIIFTEDYIILSSDCEVMACSKIKIPFEPDSKQAAFRKLIQSKLKALQPFGNQILHAQYGCASSQFTDVENALFYNIGATSFYSALSKETTVYFQRMQPNEICIFENWDFQYLYRYSLAPKGRCRYWWEHERICEWNNVHLERVNSISKATDYFLAIKQSPELVKCFEDGSETTLGLKIKLSIPRTANFTNVVSIMKPMIDGVICAFHTPDGIAAGEVSKLLNINEEIFSTTEKTCLGKRCYVSPYRKSIKWNPQDDRLDYVVIEPMLVDEKEFFFSGQLFAIPCYM